MDEQKNGLSRQEREVLARAFEREHANITADELRKILKVDDPHSRCYHLPENVLANALEQVRGGFEVFIAERPEYPQYFTTDELERDGQAFLENRDWVPDDDFGHLGVTKRLFDSYSLDWECYIGNHVPDQADYEFVGTRTFDELDFLPVRWDTMLDEKAYNKALDDAADHVAWDIQQAIPGIAHEFEETMAYLAACDAGYDFQHRSWLDGQNEPAKTQGTRQ